MAATSHRCGGRAACQTGHATRYERMHIMMIGPTYPVTRTPEQGHTAKCMAKAVIAAVEDIRDSIIDDAHRVMPESTYAANERTAQHEFRLAMQDNRALVAADEYLAEGMTMCLCPDDV